MKNKIKLNKKGFTLIELIVSITIIAVMTVVAAVSFTGVGKKARDGRRIADLQKIGIALEIFKQQNVGGSYPSTGTYSTVLVPNFIQSLPKDPKTGSSYVYSASGYTYSVCATVEDIGSTSTNPVGCSPALPAGYVGYYKIVNP